MTRYQSRDDLDIEVEDDVVYVACPDGRWAVLEGTARSLWLLIDSPRTLDEVVEALTLRYDGDRQVIADDVRTTLSGWYEQELVRTSA